MRRIAFSLLVGVALGSGCGSEPIDSGGATGGAGGDEDTGGSGGSKPGSGGSPSAKGGSGGTSSSGGSGGTGTAGTGGSGGGSAVDSGAAGTGGGTATGGSGGAATGDASTPNDSGGQGGSSAGDGGPVNSGMFPVPEGMTRIFDGKTLMGWNGNPSIWSVDPANMSIHGKTANGGQLIKTTETYDDFRLVLTERMVATPNHMGICFWGGAGGYGYGGCLDVIPPSGSMWDYGGGGQVPNQGVGSANNPIKYMWHQVEILALASTGEVLVAVNGGQTTNYKKPGRGKKGPIGLQAHAGASDQEYKDIWVEVNPKEHRLLTLKPK